MTAEVYATICVVVLGFFASWAAWVTVMIFELKAKIGLLKQEIEVLKKVEGLLDAIHKQISRKHGSHF